MKRIVLICLGLLIGQFANAQTSTNNAYADNQAEVEPGVFAIYSGDINQDGYIDPFDYSILQTDILTFAFGYVDSDLNGDGYVDPYDYAIYQQNSLNFVSSIHP
ncbi:MAG: dockerin type I domain-containing protein [Bacteroidota bacterium]